MGSTGGLGAVGPEVNLIFSPPVIPNVIPLGINKYRPTRGFEMGAWGHNTFDNDDAADWIADLENSTDMSTILEALNRVTDDAEDYLEAPECSNAVAAAEVVAALNGNASPDLPDSVREWVHGKPAADDALNARAHQAVDAVLAKSELKELWEVNTEDYPDWVACLNGIKARIPTAG